MTDQRHRIGIAAGLALASVAVLADFQSGLDAFNARDYGQARDRWQECAIAGEPACQYGVGVIHDDGLDVKADTFEALRWYEQAARKAYPDALMQLGFLYATGRGGIIQDPVQAWAYFARAAAMGVARAAESRDRIARELSIEERARAARLADEASIRYHLQK